MMGDAMRTSWMTYKLRRGGGCGAVWWREEVGAGVEREPWSVSLRLSLQARQPKNGTASSQRMPQHGEHAAEQATARGRLWSRGLVQVGNGECEMQFCVLQELRRIAAILGNESAGRAGR